MQFFFLFFLLVPLFLLLYHFLTKKYLNPYKLIFIFGKKGSGKSTLLVRLAIEYLKCGRPVYSTEKIPGTFHISYEDIGYKLFPPESVIIVDEVGMVWDNRNFKNFKNEVRDYFKLQRHYRHTVILASQTFDVDLKIRNLADEMYLVTKAFRVFSYAKRILRQTVLVKSSAEAPSKIDEDLVFDSLLFFWAGSRKLTFIPKYAKYFDSFVTPELPEGKFDLTPYPDGVKQIKVKSRGRSRKRKVRKFLNPSGRPYRIPVSPISVRGVLLGVYIQLNKIKTFLMQKFFRNK